MKNVLRRDEFGRLQHYKLDGYFIDAKGNQHAMEFNGCWYHRCLRCYSSNRESLQVKGKTMQQRYIEILKKNKSTTRIGIYSSRNVVLRLQIIPYIK